MPHDDDLSIPLERTAIFAPRARDPARAALAVDALAGTPGTNADAQSPDSTGHVEVVGAQVGGLAGEQNARHEGEDERRADQSHASGEGDGEQGEQTQVSR